jgi:hypothetical protein
MQAFFEATTESEKGVHRAILKPTHHAWLHFHPSPRTAHVSNTTHSPHATAHTAAHH